MSKLFRWKPALVGGRFEVRVDKAGAEAIHGTKRTRVKFADVTGARLLELNMRTSSVSLVLMHRSDGQVAKFVINHGGRITHAAFDENAAAFVGASAEILEGLAAAQPGIHLDLGGGPALRAVMAGLGVIMAVIGVLLALIPFGQGALDFDGIVMVGVAIMVAVGGVGLAMRYSPFSKLPTATAEEIAQIMRSHIPKR